VRAFIVAAAALTLAATSAFADVDARAQFGFGGRWVVDAATPLTLDLTNTGAEPVTVEISVSQGRGVLATDIVQRRIVQIGAGGSREDLFLMPGTQLWSGAVSVELTVDPVVAIHSPTKSADRGTLSFDVAGAGGGFSYGQIAYATHVLGVVGDERGVLGRQLTALGLADENRRDNRASRRIEAVQVAPEFLRLAPLGLDGIDALVLCDPDAQTGADPAARDGVLDWVALGGTLVVSLGEHAGQFSASPFAADMPAAWTGAGRTSYATLLSDLGARPSDAELPGPWIALTPREGTPAPDGVRHDGAPARIERRLGLGRIVLLPFDLRLALSAAWLKESDAREILAPFVAASPPSRDDDQNAWDRNDYSSAIANTLQSGAFAPPPLALVVLGIALYVVVVGPLDWFVLKRLKKERLTTLTFLGAVVAFTFLAYGASLLLFSSGARVNRIVLADLVDAGRDGRQLLRYVDIAGYYSPTGSDQRVEYPSSAVVLPAALPGAGFGGDVGSSLPVLVTTADPLRPRAVVQLAFRSQRAVRAVASGTLGSTIDVEWDHGGVRVINGLPVDLDDVAVYTSGGTAYSLGAVASGATSNGGKFQGSAGERGREFDVSPRRRYYGDDSEERIDVPRLLEAMTVGREGDRKRPDDDAAAALRKSGIDRSSAFAGRHALVVAHASKFPVALPGSQVPGSTHVVFRKEIEIP
jgi:hypothetical protein